VESKAQDDDDYQEVKRRKRHISNNNYQTAKKSTKPEPAAVKLLSKAVLTPNFFAPLRTTGMDMIVTISTTNLIRPQSDLKNTSKKRTSSEIQRI
jgi:hypothetical protein